MATREFPAALQEWRTALLADGYSLATVKVRLETVDTIAHHAGVEPTELRVAHVREYFVERDLRTGSRLAYLQHLAAWGKWTGGPDPTEGIRRPTNPKGVPNPITEDELARLLATVSGVDRCWVLLGAYAGFRAHETAKLRAEDFAAGNLRVTGKGGRTDVLPLAPVLADALSSWAGSRGRCWPGTDPRQVFTRIKSLAHHCGIEMRYHQLRHRFGTAVYTETRDLLLTQRLMRHSSPQTTAGYAAVVDAGSDVVAALPGALAEPGKRPRTR